MNVGTPKSASQHFLGTTVSCEQAPAPPGYASWEDYTHRTLDHAMQSRISALKAQIEDIESLLRQLPADFRKMKVKDIQNLYQFF